MSRPDLPCCWRHGIERSDEEGGSGARTALRGSVDADAAPRDPAGATRAEARRARSISSQQVRTEGDKVTWPTRKETLITSAMVFVMVVLASVFFLVVDQVLRCLVVSFILGLGG